MPKYETELLRAARGVATYQRQIRRLRRQLKEATKNLRLERKHLTALARAGAPPEPEIAPSRLFSGVVGYALPPREEKETIQVHSRIDHLPSPLEEVL